MLRNCSVFSFLLACLCLAVGGALADEPRSTTPIYLKLEAEDFDGFGQYKGQAPWTHRMAWYPQWSRGGDSGWWAAAGSAEASDATIYMDLVIPQSDTYVLWVRYEDYLDQPEPFTVIVQSAADGKEAALAFGAQDIVTEAQPPFAWSYAWDRGTMELTKGPATMHIVLDGAATVRRGIDCLILTTDQQWTPRDRGVPPLPYAQYLEQWAVERAALPPLVPTAGAWSVPAQWALPMVQSRDFWYLGAAQMQPGIPYPTLISNQAERAAFANAYRAQPADAPIFSSPLCAVKLHLGARELLNPDNPVRQWILERKVPFVLGGNYGSFGRIPDSYPEMVQTFGDLWVGIISGENSYLGLPLTPDNLIEGPDFKQQAYDFLFQEGMDVARRKIEEDWASTIPNPYERMIMGLSVEIRREAHRWGEIGSRVIAAESASAMPYTQTQMAFVRGAARQYDRQWLWYWGASFGDAIRTFIPENYVLNLEGLEVVNKGPIIGPSLPHIRRVMLQSYLQGATYFYPEQGNNMFDTAGQLNPMGWCYDEMLRLAERHPDRGVPWTPVALLMDHAHGWDKYTYNGERVWGGPAMRRPDRMISAVLNTAYYPFPRNEGDFVDDLNVPWPNGYFGDQFDVLVTSPTRTEAVRNYPVVFCVGDTRLDAKWTDVLQQYVTAGGTLVINAEQLTAGFTPEFLGVQLGTETQEASAVICEPDGQQLDSTLFPYTVVTPTTAQVIARTPTNDPIATVNQVGQGRVVLTTPSYLMGHDYVPLPYLPRLLLQLTSGLSPVEVRGNVQYLVNLHPEGYVVMLSNNEGIAKPSHGPARLDMAQTVEVRLSLREQPLATQDWIGEEPRPWSYPDEWLPEYTQPMQVEWKSAPDGRWVVPAEEARHEALIRLLPGEFRVFFIKVR